VCSGLDCCGTGVIHPTQAEAIAAWNRRVSSAPSFADVRIKPLEWETYWAGSNEDTRAWRPTNAIGGYWHIHMDGDSWTDGTCETGRFGSLAEAKAARQVAYEQRVRSILDIVPTPSFADGIDAEGLKREFWHDVGAPSADGRYSNRQIETAHNPQASSGGDDPWNADRLAGRFPAPHFDGESQIPAGQHLTLGQMAAILVGAGMTVERRNETAAAREAVHADDFAVGVKAAQSVVDTLIESLEEGLMTDAGLAGDDRIAMRHQIGALGVASAEIYSLRAQLCTSIAITEAQAAYALLWRMRATDKRIHEARHALLDQIGKEGQRSGLEWALRTFGPHNEPALEDLP